MGAVVNMYFWDLYVNGFCGSSIIGYRARKIFLRLVGVKLDSHTAIHMHCNISGRKLILQEGSYINRNCTIDCANAYVEIGSNVGIGFNCCLFTTNHDYSTPTKRTGSARGKSIKIGDGAWIGGGTTICPGVTVGKGCVIAAGSVVVKDCEPNCVYGGNPAKLIKKLEDKDV